MAPSQSSNSVAKVASKLKNRGLVGVQAIPFYVLNDWCLGKISDNDALALPYRLSIERFCAARHGDLADEYDDGLEHFRLNHTVPVEIPADDLSKENMLTRAEVLVVRGICRRVNASRNTSMTHELDETAQAINVQVSKRLRQKLSAALDQTLLEHKKARKRDDDALFLDVVSKLHLGAQPKHFHMYEAWCREYDNIEKIKEAYRNLAEAKLQYDDNQNKPFMPVTETIALGREFDHMDRENRGFIDAEDLVRCWGWDEEASKETIGTYDFEGRGQIDKTTFMRMMCPGEFRLPNMHGECRELLGKLLSAEVQKRKEEIDHALARFTSEGNVHESIGTIEALLPEVPRETLAHWIEIFGNFDCNHDGRVDVRELERSGILSDNVARSIAALIEPEDKTGFSQEAFIDAMLSTHGLRRVPRVASTALAQDREK